MEFVTKLKTFAMDLKTKLLPYVQVIYLFISLRVTYHLVLHTLPLVSGIHSLIQSPTI